MSIWTVKFRKRGTVVYESGGTPTITLSPLTPISLTVGTPFSRTFSATGGTGPYTYAVASGTVPTGLTMNGAVLSGTPTTAGAFSFAIRATDAAGIASSAQSFTGTIAAAVVLPPVFSLSPTITGTPTEGQTLTAATGTASGSPVYTLQWRRNGAVISGATNTTYVLQPADVGTTITVTSTATNSAGSASATSSATATVAAAPTGLDPSITAPTLSLFTANLTYPPQLDVELDDTAVVGDTIRLQWDNNADFSSLTGDATNVIDAGEASANAATFTGLSSITTGTHRFRARVERGSSYSAWSNVITQGPDDQAPTLSLPTDGTIGTTTLAPGFTSDEAGTRYHVAVPAAEATPTSTQVKAGQRANGTAAVATSTGAAVAGVNSFSLTGLTADTAYKVCTVVEDAATNLSAVLTDTITTAAAGTSVAKLTTGTGSAAEDATVNRNRYVDIQPDGYTFAGNADTGAAAKVRAVAAMPDATHVEVQITAIPSGYVVFGFSDAGLDLSSNYDRPGEGVAGFSLQITSSGVNVNYDATQPLFNVGGANDATAIAAGLIFSFDYKHSTKELTVKRKVGAAAATTLVNNVTLTSALTTNPTTTVGASASGAGGVVNFGQSAFAITPLTDHTGY